MEMDVMNNFQNWKEFLNQRVDQAQSMGMSDKTITDLAYQIGDYLSNQVDPKTNEDRLLKELWEKGSKDEQHALASLMVKMVDKK